MNDEDAVSALLGVQELKQQLSLTSQKVDQLTYAVAGLVDLLKQQHAASTDSYSKHVYDALKPVSATLFQLKSLTSYIARHQIREKGTLIRVVFLVHMIEAWDALHDIYMLMKDHPRFEPVVVTLFHDYMASHDFAHEEECYQQLTALGITPVRFNKQNSYTDLEMLKVMDPDIIFRQSPWDLSLAPAFHFQEVNFAKICYVPYGFLMIPFEAKEINTFFYKSCWRLYYDHPGQYEMLASHVKEDVLRLSGSTKIDRIAKRRHEPAWPLPVIPNTIRVIWAPHHSVEQENWINFSTFLHHYRAFLQLARECPELQLVLKPHQILFAKLVQMKLMSQQEIDQFIQDWTSLPNTALVTGGDYFPMLWASDLMITDGISFFCEYMVTEKPMIWTENPHRRPMNAIGEQLANEGTYRAGTFDQVVNYIEQLFVRHEDPLAEKRKALKQQLQPNKQGSAAYIVNDIVASFDRTESAS